MFYLPVIRIDQWLWERGPEMFPLKESLHITKVCVGKWLFSPTPPVHTYTLEELS